MIFMFDAGIMSLPPLRSNRGSPVPADRTTTAHCPWFMISALKMALRSRRSRAIDASEAVGPGAFDIEAGCDARGAGRAAHAVSTATSATAATAGHRDSAISAPEGL
jgi:hypothetical protein